MLAQKLALWVSFWGQTNLNKYVSQNKCLEGLTGSRRGDYFDLEKKNKKNVDPKPPVPKIIPKSALNGCDIILIWYDILIKSIYHDMIYYDNYQVTLAGGSKINLCLSVNLQRVVFCRLKTLVGSMVLWFYGSIVIWFYGSMVLWFYVKQLFWRLN